MSDYTCFYSLPLPVPVPGSDKLPFVNIFDPQAAKRGVGPGTADMKKTCPFLNVIFFYMLWVLITYKSAGNTGALSPTPGSSADGDEFGLDALLNLKMPDRIIESSSSAAHTTLRTRLNSRLKMLPERNNASVTSITIAYRRSNSPNTTATNTNPG